MPDPSFAVFQFPCAATGGTETTVVEKQPGQTNAQWAQSCRDAVDAAKEACEDDD